MNNCICFVDWIGRIALIKLGGCSSKRPESETCKLSETCQRNLEVLKFDT
jgi:hypothetical protein